MSVSLLLFADTSPSAGCVSVAYVCTDAVTFRKTTDLLKKILR